MMPRSILWLLMGGIALWGTTPLAAFAQRIELANGDVLEVESIEENETGFLIAHPVLGTIQLGEDQIAAIGPPPVSAAPEEEALAEPIPEGLFGSNFLYGWNRQFGMGISGTRGNSESQDWNAGIAAGYEDEVRRWVFDARYFYTESNGEVSKDEGYVDLIRDWIHANQRHFYFAQLRWDIDEFEAWDHRGSIGGGIGTTFVDVEDFVLRGRSGLAVTRSFGGIDEETDYELLLRLETDWSPWTSHSISAYNAVYPSVKDTGEFRNLTGITWNIDLAGSEGLGLQLGVLNEYESDVEADTERNDLQYFGNLVYDF